MKPSTSIGRTPLQPLPAPASGDWARLGDTTYYRITNADALRPFFLSVVSSSDLWMFISSTGALTAGRGTPDMALFPYCTDDKIHDSAGTTGSTTLLHVQTAGRTLLWEPFSCRTQGAYRTRRNLYKNTLGNQLLFEECNDDLGLTFRYGWFSSHQFGFVRRSWLINHNPSPARVQILDGLLNLMPCGIGSQFQSDKSTLLDAYKRSELLPQTQLALYRLSAVPIDRPEPAESLRTTVAWSVGLPRHTTLLSARQIDRFRQGVSLQPETDVRAERGACLLHSSLRLRPNQTASWLLVADVNRGPADVVDLDRRLRRPAQLQRQVLADIDRGTRELEQIIHTADGAQLTAWSLGDARHAGNVLFNVMRGGIFASGYTIDPDDLREFIAQASRSVADRQARFLARLKPGTTCHRLNHLAAQTGDPQLQRLCQEYLPLTFSRRHGDPSRPWNRFSIATRKPDGSPVLNYEGNWRDIFQNWEALATSYPAFVPAMISRFVSASTADGYNPYRVTRNGIDWEVVDPHDPWAHIGYWGDHQIIYLLKLLELLQRHQPQSLQDFLGKDLFAYANVPYRIHPYPDLLRDPKNTVAFDHPLETLVEQRVKERGSDGKLVWDPNHEVRLVNLTEKLLVPILAKLTNFIPGAGIWLNTQRPEWNDANNALVGNGVSIVTLCYLRRHLTFCLNLFSQPDASPRPVSVEVLRLFQSVTRILQQHQPLLRSRINDHQRRQVLDDLGTAGSRYRQQLYRHGFSGRRQTASPSSLRRFLSVALEWVDHTLRSNQRPDGLYHSYNLVRFEQPGLIPIRRLQEMLEGQVAILSSGLLSPHESLEVLKALRQSSMYRPDQHSYLLYPDRDLPGFTAKNNIPAGDVRKSKLLRALVQCGDRSIVEQDSRGASHFAGTLTNAQDLTRALQRLNSASLRTLARRETPQVLALFEKLFDHESFTGRSGTFFAYEGLGSIYWHMVSKLLLAAQESFHAAADLHAPRPLLRQLAARYRDIRTGLGDHKSPAEYGAFPMDPYSHTPAHTGARQPGLTGQVKEDILCRQGELGLFVRDGRLHFQPQLLQSCEFLTEPQDFRYHDVLGNPRRLRLPARSLAFTCCQVPVIYRLARKPKLTVTLTDGSKLTSSHPALDKRTSQSIFDRDASVLRINVDLQLAG